MSNPHTVRAYDQELAALSEILTQVGHFVVDAFTAASKALLHKDLLAAQEAIQIDSQIDELCAQADKDILLLMTKRQPMSQDLQEILAAMRSTNEFSHIGDLACNIAERSTQLQSPTAPERLYQGLETLSMMLSDFLSRVSLAYASKDISELTELCQVDKLVDNAYAQILDVIIIGLANHPDRTSDLTHLLFCIKNMDRIGDHISHIAQTRYLALTGALPEHIKHSAPPKS